MHVVTASCYGSSSQLVYVVEANTSDKAADCFCVLQGSVLATRISTIHAKRAQGRLCNMCSPTPVPPICSAENIHRPQKHQNVAPISWETNPLGIRTILCTSAFPEIYEKLDLGHSILPMPYSQRGAPKPLRGGYCRCTRSPA